jgi:hypothetical protein
MIDRFLFGIGIILERERGVGKFCELGKHLKMQTRLNGLYWFLGSGYVMELNLSFFILMEVQIIVCHCRHAFVLESLPRWLNIMKTSMVFLY